MPETERRPRTVLVIRSIVQRNEDEILLIRRSEKESYLPGVWEFPGGKLDKDQNLSTAQKIEVKQETGLDIETTQHLIRVEDYMIESGKYDGLPYIVLVGLARVVGGGLVLSEEHDKSKWIKSEEDLEGLDTKPEVSMALPLFRNELGWDS